MIEIKRFSGPVEQREAVRRSLKGLGIPSHSVSVYEENRDTGYPGLAVNKTIVDLNVGDSLLKKAVDILSSLGFSEG